MEKKESLLFICRKVHVDRGFHLSRGLVKWWGRITGKTGALREKFFFHCTKLLRKKQWRFQSKTKQSAIVDLSSLWDTKVMSQCCFKTGLSKQGPVTKPNQTKLNQRNQSFLFPMGKDLWKREWVIFMLAYQHLSGPTGLYEFGMERIHDLELTQNGGYRIYETRKQMNHAIETYQT